MRKDLLNMLKELYRVSEEGLEWKELHPNNMLCNPVEGVYAFIWIPDGKEYTLFKYTIKFQRPIGEDFCIHMNDEIKYYNTFEYREKFDKIYTIPEAYDPNTTKVSILEYSETVMKEEGRFPHCIVNDEGRFICTFDNLETAKKSVCHDLKAVIYPYTYILEDDERAELQAYFDSFKK